MPTACEDQGNACGYVEDVSVAGQSAYQKHFPRKPGDPTDTNVVGVVVKRGYCVLKAGHAGGHSYRTQ